MHTNTFTLLALSASAVLASPFHKRQSYEHHRFHGTGVSGSIRPSGTGHFHTGNSTEGLFGTGTGSVPVLTKTVSPLPQESDSEATGPSTFANVASSAVTAETTTSCVSTSVVTETSINFLTVTASGAQLAVSKFADAANTIEATAQASPGQFWGSKSYGGGSSQSTAASTGNSVALSAAKPSKTFTTVASSAGTSAAASVSATSAPSTGSSGGKRGISFNTGSLVSAFGSSVSWAYNWGATASGLTSGVEFVPLMWGLDQVSGFASKVGSATHVLSFNEPDLSTQSNIDPQTAATKHIEGMKSLVGKVKIGSPAITNGNSQSPLMGLPWLNQWFQACAGNCPVDFVAFHWYAGANNIDYFKTYVQSVISAAAANGVSKVWLTEFAPDGTADAQASFMKEAVAFLDATAAVERYAGFMASDGTMLTGSSLNSVGQAYASAS